MKLTHCPTHAQILDVAREEIAAKNKFMKKDLLESTKLTRYGNLIVWSFVRATIEAELGEVLQPISDANGHWDPAIHPEKFLPGARRKTAGYARATALAPEVATAWAQRRYNTFAGIARSFEALASSYQRQGIPIEFHPTKLPPLQVTRQ